MQLARFGAKKKPVPTRPARQAVGEQPAYTTQVEYLCEDISVLRARVKKLDKDMSDTLGKHELGTLLTTAARLVATLGDPSSFRSPEALAAYVGVVPGISHPGKRPPRHAAILPKVALTAAIYSPMPPSSTTAS